MPEQLYFVVAIAVFALLYLVVRFVGNAIVDRSQDALRNARARKDRQTGQHTEDLADRYRK